MERRDSIPHPPAECKGRFTRAALESNTGSSAAKSVLVCLAIRADAYGNCTASYQSVSADCELSRRSVMRQVQLLEELGLIEIDRDNREKGAPLPNRYRLLLPQEEVPHV